VLSVEDWAEIRRLHRSEQMPIKAIARLMGCSKNTVKRALAADGPPRSQRAGPGSVVDEVEPRIRELLRAWPWMPATVIAERVGWSFSIRLVGDRVAELRLVYLPPDPASRTAYAAGRSRSATFGSPRSSCRSGSTRSRGSTRLPVLVMACGCSGWLSARLLPTRAAEDLFAGWWSLIQALGRCRGWGLGRGGRGRAVAARGE
jgi:transposase